MAKEIQKIYGYVDLTDAMREWLKEQRMKGSVSAARGWQVFPAHHRMDPLKSLILTDYTDCEESYRYWFDNPEKRDRQTYQPLKEPLPIMSERDKQFFYEENAKSRERVGWERYVIFRANRDFVQEYSPDTDFYDKKTKSRPEVAKNVGSTEKPIKVANDRLSSRLQK